MVKRLASATRRAQKSTSRLWQAMSPMVPVPNSRHERQLNGCSPSWYSRKRAGPIHSSQCRPLGHRFARRALAVAAEVAAEDGVRLGDLADRPGPDVFAHQADGLTVVSLVAHLRRHVLFLGGLHQGIALGHVVGHRLLHERRLAQLDRPHRRRGVVMVGRGDEHDVDVLLALVVHLAIVVIVRTPGEVLVFLKALAMILSSTSTRATARSLAATPGCPPPMPPQPMTATPSFELGERSGQNGGAAEQVYAGRAASGGGGRLEEIAARGTIFHVSLLGVG